MSACEPEHGASLARCPDAIALRAVLNARASAHRAYERAKRAECDTRKSYDAVLDALRGATDDEQFEELATEQKRLGKLKLELTVEIMQPEQDFLKADFESDEAVFDVIDREMPILGDCATSDAMPSDGRGHKRARAAQAAEDSFACPCGDPWLEPLRALLEPLLSRARFGEPLTAAEASELLDGQLAHRLLSSSGEGEECASSLPTLQRAATLSRAIYQQSVSWSLVSEEWCDGLAALLRSRGVSRVLEVRLLIFSTSPYSYPALSPDPNLRSSCPGAQVAAGAGVLREPMRARGLLWHTSDLTPAQVGLPDDGTPEKCDALAALKSFGDGLGGTSGMAGTDAVFWSWWPRGDDGDAALARECVRRGLPAIFVGEPRGGITGSDAIWEGVPPPRRLSGWVGAPLEGVDAPRWPGMHDCTWVVQGHTARTAREEKGS